MNEPTDTPRVIRSPWLAPGKAYIFEGVMFEDGLRRVYVPADTSDEVVAAAAEALEERDEVMRGLVALERLLPRTSPPSHAREVVEQTAFGPVRRPDPAFDAAAFDAAVWSDYVETQRRSFESRYGPSRHGHRLPPTVEQLAEFEAWKTAYERLQEDGYAAGWLRSGYEPDEIAEPLGVFVYDEPEEDYAKRRAEWEAQQPKGGSVAIPVRYAPVRYER